MNHENRVIAVSGDIGEHVLSTLPEGEIVAVTVVAVNLWVRALAGNDQ